MSGLSAQSSVLNELRSVVIDQNDKNDKNEKNETDKDAFRLSNTTDTNELQLHMDALAAPSYEPPVLAVIPASAPGMLEEMWEKTLPSPAKVLATGLHHHWNHHNPFDHPTEHTHRDSPRRIPRISQIL